jgi:hypothetical protein
VKTSKPVAIAALAASSEIEKRRNAFPPGGLPGLKDALNFLAS